MAKPVSILLIEDNPKDRALIKTMLSRAFRQPVIHVAATQESVKTMLRHASPDIIVASDVVATFSVLDVIEWVRELGQDLPIVVLTGSTGAEKVAIQALEKGVGDYIFKSPEHLERLPATMRYVLQRLRRQQASRIAIAELRYRTDLIRIIADVSKDFINVSMHEIDRQIGRALRVVAQFLNTDRAYVILFSGDKSTVKDVHEWCTEGLDPQISRLKGLPVQVLRPAVSVVQQGSIYYVPRLAVHTVGTPQLTGSMETLCSLINLPIISNSSVLGLIGFESIRSEREWPETILALLKTLGDVFAKALEQKRTSERLQREALHDVLTGLPNRTLLLDQIQRSIAKRKRDKRHIFAILFLDLDGFKAINDTLGHAAGDYLLITVAERLTSNLRPGDTVARLGGDEFTILLDDLKDFSATVLFAQRIMADLAQPIEVNSKQVTVTASVGIAVSMSGRDNPDELLRNADQAMYEAKRLGKARYQIFDPSMHSYAMKRLRFETELRQAWENQQFVTYYQPVVSLATGKIIGFEALLRWQHPQRGVLIPEEFMSVAEDTNLILPMSKWVISEAYRQVCGWQDQMNPQPPLTLFVNLTTARLLKNDIVQFLDESLNNSHGYPGCRLKLEIPEHVVLENAEPVNSILTQLSPRHIQLCIDAFGVGRSALSYRHLHRLPVNTLKIDRSLVRGLGREQEDSEVTKTIIKVAYRLGACVVAVGVETQEQLEHLKQLNCQYVQGNYFSAPVDAESATKILVSGVLTR